MAMHEPLPNLPETAQREPVRERASRGPALLAAAAVALGGLTAACTSGTGAAEQSQAAHSAEAFPGATGAAGDIPAGAIATSMPAAESATSGPGATASAELSSEQQIDAATQKVKGAFGEVFLYNAVPFATAKDPEDGKHYAIMRLDLDVQRTDPEGVEYDDLPTSSNAEQSKILRLEEGETPPGGEPGFYLLVDAKAIADTRGKTGDDAMVSTDISLGASAETEDGENIVKGRRYVTTVGVHMADSRGYQSELHAARAGIVTTEVIPADETPSN